ncbi:MAG: hypothetical protein Q7T11_06725 [Deltaproteobacteria bacterium]|nr:hypothetical protein [Deltaproteobacteria bacterium]
MQKVYFYSNHNLPTQRSRLKKGYIYIVKFTMKFLLIILFLIVSFIANAKVVKNYEPGILKKINADAREQPVPRSFNINGTVYNITRNEVITTRIFIIKGDKFTYESAPLKKFSALEFVEGTPVKFRLEGKRNRLYLATKSGKELPTSIIKVTPLKNSL